MKRTNIQRILLALTSLAFLLALLLLGHRLLDYRRGKEIYLAAAKLACLPAEPDIMIASEDAIAAVESEETVSVSNNTLDLINFDALRQVNPDVLGWIMIPETILSYPIVQGEDNQFYLDHAWDRSKSSVGSIYLEAQCSPDFTDFNTIIYGHRMRNSSMFGSLKHYNSQEYRTSHPNVLITDEHGTRTYQIFAALEAEINAPIYLVNVTAEDEKQTILDYALEKNILDTGIIPDTDDQIVTLCTCTGRGYEKRWVVLGVLATD